MKGIGITFIPEVSNDGRVIALPSQTMNAYIETDVYNDFSVYQQLYAIYGSMKLSNRQKHVYHHLMTDNLLLQPGHSCAPNPMGGASMNKFEVNPCDSELYIEQCNDELIGSCFENLVSLRNGILDITGYADLMKSVVAHIGYQYQSAASMAQHMGQFYASYYPDFDDAFNADLTADVKKRFEIASNVCEGYVTRVQNMALEAGNSHLDQDNIITADMVDGDGFVAGVSFIDIYDNLKAGAPKTLRDAAIRKMYRSSTGRTRYVYVGVSDALYNLAVTEYNNLCENPACVNRRLSKKEITVGGGMFEVYFIDGLPIIPKTEFTDWDQYVVGTTFVMEITLSQNIALGSSFDNLPAAYNGLSGNTGLLLQQVSTEDISKWGLTRLRGWLLTSNVVIDKRYYTATIEHYIPE